MKKYIFATALVVFGVLTNFAQVGIGTTTPNANAALDVSSTSQGMLFPRMTSTQRDAISNPAKGLTIYNTTLNSLQTNTGTSGTPNWKAWNGIHPSTNGTGVVSAYNCSTASAGTLTAGVAVSGVTQTITATVTTAGTYSISTTTNGVTFAASGTFAGTAAQDIVLIATGTPTTSSTNTFSLNTTPNCNFTRTANQPSTNGTAIVSSYTCNTGTAGTMTAGVAVSGVTQTITAAVTTIGSYNISTTANGITFVGSGNFSGSTGNKTIVLNATGTPIASGNNTFTLNTITSTISSFVRYTSATGCYAKISSTASKEFLCHNLGADTSLNPHVPVVGLNGAYIQWGKRGPNTTGVSSIDWQTAANDGPNGFAAAPTAANANAGSIPNWSTVGASNYSWRTAAGAKTANDPCPQGFRVPTGTELTGLIANNTASRTGTFTNSNTNYGAALHFGPNSSTKTLTWPATGGRNNSGGAIQNRGSGGYYISSTESGNINVVNIAFDNINAVNNASPRLVGYPVRCIAE